VLTTWTQEQIKKLPMHYINAWMLPSKGHVLQGLSQIVYKQGLIWTFAINKISNLRRNFLVSLPGRFCWFKYNILMIGG
jgi:hypothetical protein